jgi:hypothetical protein
MNILTTTTNNVKFSETFSMGIDGHGGEGGDKVT